MSNRTREIVFFSLLGAIIFFAVSGFCLRNMRTAYSKLGTHVVTTMYTFQDLEDLNEKYGKLETVLDESLWDEFSLASDSRVISAYFRFQNSPTSVDIISDDGCVVVYRLINDYIDPNKVFICDYEVVNNKVVSLREYEVKGLCWGAEGVW